MEAEKKNRVQERFVKQVHPALMKQFAYKTPMQVPRLTKIVINSGVGEALINGKAIDETVYAITQISGQKPVVTKSKKSIAAFKLRDGVPIGCMVTLRNKRMYEFFDRLISVALPRHGDFRGLPFKKGFDGRGNYTMGLKESIAFPEVDLDKLTKIGGMDITFVTTANTNDEGKALLEGLGLPFRK